MSTLIGSLNANTIIQGLIALVSIAGTFGLMLNRIPVPDVIILLDGAITAYYFTNMTAVNTAKAVVNGQTYKNGQ